MKMRQYNDVTGHTGQHYVENKTELLWSRHYWLYRCSLYWNRNWTVMIDQIMCSLWQRWDRTMTRSIILVQSTPKSKQDAINHENQTGQQCDQLKRCDLHRIWYWTVKTKWAVCGLWQIQDRTTMWLIVQVCSMPRTKLNCYDQSNEVRSMMKTRHDNNVTDCIGSVYAKIGIKLT